MKVLRRSRLVGMYPAVGDVRVHLLSRREKVPVFVWEQEEAVLLTAEKSQNHNHHFQFSQKYDGQHNGYKNYLTSRVENTVKPRYNVPQSNVLPRYDV